MAIEADDRVTGNQDVRKLEERVRELERLLGRKTMEVEILKEALAKSQSKKLSPNENITGIMIKIRVPINAGRIKTNPINCLLFKSSKI